MMHEIRFPVNDPADPMSAFFVTGAPEAVHALQIMLKDRFQDGRAVGRAESEDEITRLRVHMKAIADHHEAERDKAEFAHMDAAARYHEDRRNVAMFPLIVQTQGTPLPLEMAG